MRVIQFTALIFAAALCSATVAIAGTVKVEGTITYKVTHLSDEKLPGEGRVLSRDAMAGVIKSKPSDQAIDGSIQTCIGAMVVTEGKAEAGSGYCDTVDADGDVWWLSWSAGPVESTWTVIGGTGKYKDLTGRGQTFYVGDLQGVQVSGWSQAYKGGLTFK